MKHDKTKELRRLSVRLAVIEQKCDLILAQLSTMNARNGLDEMIDRLHRQARAMRDNVAPRR
ncbi:MAG: hypothetical protein IJS04_04135 [Muribaculaceae bacterium]|nr:hypothetical protein [Muribaculaceae bacterium]